MIEYYSTIKRIEALICAITWVKLENTRLSERSQSHVVGFYLCEMSIETGSRLLVTRGWGNRRIGCAFLVGTGLLFG
jgi:hypothetical protein